MLDVGSEYPNDWDRKTLFAWAPEQGFDTAELLPFDPSVTDGRVAYRGNTVYVYDSEDGHTLARFVGDAKMTSLTVLPDDVIAAGDGAGRVIFLRWQPPAG